MGHWKIISLIVMLLLIWAMFVFAHRLFSENPSRENGTGAAVSFPVQAQKKKRVAPAAQKKRSRNKIITASLSGTEPFDAVETNATAAVSLSPSPTPRTEEEEIPVASTAAQLHHIGAQETLSISRDPKTLAITTERLPVATVNLPYYCPLLAAGGSAPYRWRLAAGTLPKGLSLDQTGGIIAGEPEFAGAVEFTIEVTDKTGARSRKNYLLVSRKETGIIVPRPEGVRTEPLYLITGSLPEGALDTPYSVQLEAHGGAPPYVWTVREGALPAGVQLSPARGLLWGKPNTVEQPHFLVEVADQDQRTDIAEYSIAVRAEKLSITTTALAEATMGEFYACPLEAYGGVPPYRWSISEPALPTGLSLDTGTGEISGTPEYAGTFPADFCVGDSAGVLACKAFTLVVIAPKLTIVTGTVPSARRETAYETTLEADGGLPPYTWAVTEGDLPAGLALDPVTGSIYGTPETEATAESVVITVTDTSQNNAKRRFSIDVEEAPKISVTELTATPSHGKVALTWKNPEEKRFLKVAIVRDTDVPPRSPEEGTVIYTGTGETFLDGNLANGVHYFYTAFALTKEGVPGEPTEEAMTSSTPEDVSLQGPADPYADAVYSFSPLANGGFGSTRIPDIVLGAPDGAGEMRGSIDVVSLHARRNDDNGATSPYGGTITLEFTDNIIVNGAGPDFVVFENVFFSGGDPEQRWMEPAVVSVSQNGVRYYTFPFDFVPHYNADGTLNLTNPFCYQFGFAGINPVYPAADPRVYSVAGGDPFDLSSLPGAPLAWIRFVRITATGDNWLVDVNGDTVRHIAEVGACSGNGASGFDLDAVCAINY
jgi:hypothetical protein